MAPILLTGAGGTLGQCVVRAAAQRALAIVPLRRSDADLTDRGVVEGLLQTHAPWAVINAAGYVRVDDAEQEPLQCHRDNVLVPEVLARACAGAGIPFLTFSSDLVFDGRKPAPYDETDPAGPLSVYGATKFEAECRVLAAHAGSLVVRTSAFFGPWDRHNFLTRALLAAREGSAVHAAADVQVSPTYVPDLVCGCLDLLIDGERGLWHLSNGGSISWADLAVAALETGGAPVSLVCRVQGQAPGWRARRPRNSALTSARGVLLPSLDDALRRWRDAMGAGAV